MNETLKTIRLLRSARNDFNERKVSEEIMEQIIDTSMKAANASNTQRYSMILVDKPDLLKAITNKDTAQTAIVYCLDYNRIIETAQHMGLVYNPCTNNWYDMISGIFDVSALAQTAVIAAASLGVDTVITNSVLRENQNEILEKLKLPKKYCIAVMAVLFGYRDAPLIEQNNRLPREYILHHNEYRQLKESEHNEIISFYDNLYPMYIDETYPHYLDYYYKQWCGHIDDAIKDNLERRMLEAGFKID